MSIYQHLQLEHLHLQNKSKNVNTSDYPNLPTLAWIKKHTIALGGETMIIGLTSAQANELLRFARDKSVTGSGHNKIKLQPVPLDASERLSLAQRFEIPDGSVEVYLGHTTTCHQPLYGALSVA